MLVIQYCFMVKIMAVLCFEYNLIQMNLIERTQFKIAVGTLGIGAILYGLYQAYQHFIKNRTQRPIFDLKALDIISQSPSSQEDNNIHCPYKDLIEDLHCGQLSKGELIVLTNITDIQYSIILCLTKGITFTGIVNLSFNMTTLTKQDHFSINYQGTGIKYLKVNSVRIEPHQVLYQNHQIIIPRDLLKQQSKNHIEIIYENSYSFLGTGLSSYFVIDDNHKYSLKQQVIYSVQGWNQISQIIPCLNCTNECRVQIEVIHPETFATFSNSTIKLKRVCSVNEYPNYPFLFELVSNSISKILKMNSSNASLISKMSDTISNYSYNSQTMYNGRKRANTHFHPTKLPSIHNLFLFCSAMTEIHPQLTNNPIEDELLIRYFCKFSESHHFQDIVSHIHHYVIDVFQCLAEEEISKKVDKVQIFIINDNQVDGSFAPGAIILSQKTVKEITTDFRCFYLIARAICGLLRLANKNNTVSLKDINTLNSYVFDVFDELRNYMYLQNIKYHRIRTLLKDSELQQYVHTNQAHILQFYAKELRYILKEDVSDHISFEIKNLISIMKRKKTNEFWGTFISNYKCISPLTIDLLVELGIRQIGISEESYLLDQLKICLQSSRHILSFYSDKQIQDNLPKFLVPQTEGLERRLSKIKILHRFKEFIKNKYINYLPGKSNIVEAEAFYNQFKKFNEYKNFHHLGTLRKEIQRVRCFGQTFIIPERLGLNCSLLGWKLMRHLRIYPVDQKRFTLLKVMGAVEQF